MNNDIELAVSRLSVDDQSLRSWRRKLHAERRLLAGDVSVLSDWGNSQKDSEGEQTRRAHQTEFYDILNTDFEGGRTNELLRTCRTLIQQVTYNFPEIEAEDLDYEEAVLHAEYARTRLGPPPLGCNAVPKMRRALWDYIAGGFGWAWIGMAYGRPIIEHVDSLDVKFDPTASTPAEAQWASITRRKSLAYWRDWFGDDRLKPYIDEFDPKADSPIELEFYYSIEGDKGKYMVLFLTGRETVDMKPVVQGPNPCRWQYGGDDVPFIPLEPVTFIEIPSVTKPISLVEQMLPHQIAIWEMDRKTRNIIGCPAGYDADADSYDEAEFQKFEDGDTGGVYRRKPGSPPMSVIQALEIPSGWSQYRADNVQALTGQGGANPYATGSPVEGTTYAAEVHAIEGAAGLMAGSIAKDNADFWIRVLRKFYAKGAESDDRPLVARFEDIDLVFGPQNPIKVHLKPDARFTIRESSTQYMDARTQVELAARDLATALSVQAMFPRAVGEAYEGYLRARGERNVKKYLEPLPAPTAPGAGGMPPQMGAPGMGAPAPPA